MVISKSNTLQENSICSRLFIGAIIAVVIAVYISGTWQAMKMLKNAVNNPRNAVSDTRNSGHQFREDKEEITVPSMVENLTPLPDIEPLTPHKKEQDVIQMEITPVPTTTSPMERWSTPSSPEKQHENTTAAPTVDENSVLDSPSGVEPDLVADVEQSVKSELLTDSETTEVPVLSQQEKPPVLKDMPNEDSKDVPDPNVPVSEPGEVKDSEVPSESVIEKESVAPMETADESKMDDVQPESDPEVQESVQNNVRSQETELTRESLQMQEFPNEEDVEKPEVYAEIVPEVPHVQEVQQVPEESSAKETQHHAARDLKESLHIEPLKQEDKIHAQEPLKTTENQEISVVNENEEPVHINEPISEQFQKEQQQQQQSSPNTDEVQGEVQSSPQVQQQTLVDVKDEVRNSEVPTETTADVQPPAVVEEAMKSPSNEALSEEPQQTEQSESSTTIPNEPSVEVPKNMEPMAEPTPTTVVDVTIDSVAQVEIQEPNLPVDQLSHDVPNTNEAGDHNTEAPSLNLAQTQSNEQQSVPIE